MTEPHIEGIMLFIDDGRDDDLLILADALEDKGDRRAQGLRDIHGTEYRPTFGFGLHRWQRRISPEETDKSIIPRRLYYRLPAVPYDARPGHTAVVYPTRSDAFLALAEAFVHNPKGIVWEDFVDAY